MPRIASVRLAAGARRSPMRLFDAVTVVPAENDIPLTVGEVVLTAPFCEISQILFFEMVTVAPLLTEIPLAMGEVAPEPDSVEMEFWLTFAVRPPATAIPTTVEEAPVDDSPLIVLELMLLVLGYELVRPVTVPPAPVEVKPVIEFDAMFSVVAVPLAPIDIPVMVL